MNTGSTSSGRESPFEVVTPKKARSSKATPKAAGDDGVENGGGNASVAEVKLLIEMIATLGESSNGIKFNWAAISEKLGLPSAGATYVPTRPLPLTVLSTLQAALLT